MVYPFLTGSTLLRTQRTILPRTFLRYKSITSAIERGRNDGPDRPFRPRTRSFNDGGNGNGDGEVKTRREARFEKFGPARDEASPREVRTTSPRSSRFGRVPRDDDAPSRVDNRETRPPRPWEGRGRQGPGTGFPGQQEKWQKQTMSPWTLAGHNRLDNEGSPVKDSMQGENSAREERAPRPERRFDRTSTPFGDRPARDFGRDDRGGERRQFGRDDRGGERRDFNRDFKRDDGGGERKPFARDDRGGERRGFGGDDRGGERKPFSRDDRGGDRKPFSRDDRGGERKPFNRDDRGGERKPFSRDDRGGERRDFTRDDRGGERKEFSRDERRERPDFKQERPERFTPRDGDAPPSTFRPRDTTNREPRFTHHPDSKGARRERTGREDTDAAPSSSPAVLRGPESLPYTTAASEFIYGHSSVLAAIKANRRKFYTLYVHSRGASRDGLMSRIRAHKLFSITQEVGDEYMRALDKASSGRPHNGVVMESSPLPVPPITELKTSSMEDESFGVGLDSQSKEDEEVNGKSEIFPYKSAGWRNPLVLYVDGVVDEGNLGAIARSAYILGADAIVTPTHHTASWSHIAMKASAGAAEALPVFKTGQPTEFLNKSAQAGWKIYAADTIPPAPASLTSAAETEEGKEGKDTKVVYTINKSSKRLPAEHSPVGEHPTILMLGAEGTGLKTSLLNMAHYKVGIPHGREVDEVGVDSLNVSVAASILCYEMLQRPGKAVEKAPEDILF